MVSIPRFLASLGELIDTGSPSMKISPESAFCAPDRVLIKVDLPAPLPPTKPRISRAEVDGDVLDRARTPKADTHVPHLDQGDAAVLRGHRHRAALLR